MKKRAFTLVELVISVTLLTVVMMLVFNLFPAASVALQRSQHEVKANSLAQSYLEVARAQPFPTLKPGSTDLPPVEDGVVSYKVQRTVSVLSGEPAAEILGVKVTVRWTYRNRPHELSQETYCVPIPR